MASEPMNFEKMLSFVELVRKAKDEKAKLQKDFNKIQLQQSKLVQRLSSMPLEPRPKTIGTQTRPVNIVKATKPTQTIHSSTNVGTQADIALIQLSTTIGTQADIQNVVGKSIETQTDIPKVNWYGNNASNGSQASQMTSQMQISDQELAESLKNKSNDDMENPIPEQQQLVRVIAGFCCKMSA